MFGGACCKEHKSRFKNGRRECQSEQSLSERPGSAVQERVGPLQERRSRNIIEPAAEKGRYVSTSGVKVHQFHRQSGEIPGNTKRSAHARQRDADEPGSADVARDRAGTAGGPAAGLASAKVSYAARDIADELCGKFARESAAQAAGRPRRPARTRERRSKERAREHKRADA